MGTKRLRIFAGPNGSGKSELYNYLLSQQFFHLYVYINADDIAKGLADGYSFANWPVSICASDFFSYVEKSSFSKLIKLEELKASLTITDSMFIWNGGKEGLTYISACIADYMRGKLLCASSSFACETVFSHPSKIDFIKRAKENGFKVYLYFIATRDPLINQGRVENRARGGGHDVPADKIVSRYYRCLDNLYAAVCLCDKTFLFDNSESKTDFTYNNFAEVIDGSCRIISGSVPEWFVTSIYNKLPQAEA
ncbi:MAG: hypothetical protein HDR32_08500 [Treponema sp.]|nr:hypothetical protein [Treponema sp.]